MKPKRIPLLKKGKNKKHDKLVNDYDAQKSKHLDFSGELFFLLLVEHSQG